jgi:hypothetical protein
MEEIRFMLMIAPAFLVLIPIIYFMGRASSKTDAHALGISELKKAAEKIAESQMLMTKIVERLDERISRLEK